MWDTVQPGRGEAGTTPSKAMVKHLCVEMERVEALHFEARMQISNNFECVQTVQYSGLKPSH
jgi:hypothetical protein